MVASPRLVRRCFDTHKSGSFRNMKPRSANAPRQQAPFWPIEGAVPILRNKPIPIGQLSYDGPEFTQTSDVECPFRGWMCATRSKRVVICSRRVFRIYAASIAVAAARPDPAIRGGKAALNEERRLWNHAQADGRRWPPYFEAGEGRNRRSEDEVKRSDDVQYLATTGPPQLNR